MQQEVNQASSGSQPGFFRKSTRLLQEVNQASYALYHYATASHFNIRAPGTKSSVAVGQGRARSSTPQLLRPYQYYTNEHLLHKLQGVCGFLSGPVSTDDERSNQLKLKLKFKECLL